MSRLSYNFFAVEFQKDNSEINKLYELVISTGPETYSTFDEYAQIIRFLVEKYIQYNDYLHSNNLLQAFRINCNTKAKVTDEYDWFLYYSIKTYSKRSIKYYLDNPSIFWENVYKLVSNLKSDYTVRLDNLLVDTLEFYKKEYVNYPKFLRASIIKFVNYYFNNKEYSTTITAHLKELKKLTTFEDKEKVEEIYNSLESQNISGVEIPVNQNLTLEEYKKYEKEKAIEDNYYGDISLDDADRSKKIMIVGDDPFVKNKQEIYGIAKKYNINKDQIIFFTDYDKIKKEGETIISKTQYKDEYMGIIFGSMPHSTSGNSGASSLIAKVTTDSGFPYSVVCRAESQSGKPKITRTSFTKALIDVIINYKSK